MKDLIFSEVIPFAVDPNNPSVAPPFDEHLRRIERGAQIVVAVPNDVSLILQMPRGNLETVYPRAFALTSLRQKLNERDFKSAFTICRKHRIDTNVLFDHCEKMFTLETWKEFILQIGNVDYLNLFITNLRDEDVCVSMYSKANKTLSEKYIHGLIIE